MLEQLLTCDRKPLREVKQFSVYTISTIKPRYDIYALNT